LELAHSGVIHGLFRQPTHRQDVLGVRLDPRYALSRSFASEFFFVVFVAVALAQPDDDLRRDLL